MVLHVVFDKRGAPTKLAFKLGYVDWPLDTGVPWFASWEVCCFSTWEIQDVLFLLGPISQSKELIMVDMTCMK